jgi:hypothetical protein
MFLPVSFIDFRKDDTGDHDQDCCGAEAVVREWHGESFKLNVLSFRF